MGIFYTEHPALDAAGARAGEKTGKTEWGRILVGFLVVIVLFALALVLENTGQHEEASKTLLHVVEVTLTAILALLGIERAKAQS
jgi:uncharacterized membrane protein